MVNNVRDRVTDAAAGKRTLAVRFGRAAGVAEYVAMALAAYAMPPALWLRGLSDWKRGYPEAAWARIDWS